MMCLTLTLRGESMNNLDHDQPNALRHPGIREMYAHLQSMATKLPESYPPGTADRYLAVAQKNWEQNDFPQATAIAEAGGDDWQLAVEDEYLISA